MSCNEYSSRTILGNLLFMLNLFRGHQSSINRTTLAINLLYNKRIKDVVYFVVLNRNIFATFENRSKLNQIEKKLDDSVVTAITYKSRRLSIVCLRP